MKPTEGQIKLAMAFAHDRGRDDGLAAGGWVVDGNTDSAAARRLFDGIEAGDPAVLDTLPGPDLSGQNADGWNGPRLVEEAWKHAGIHDEHVEPDGLFNEICDEYEEAFTAAVESIVSNSAQEKM